MLVQRGALSSLDGSRVAEAARVEARSAATHLAAADQRLEHAIEVVVAIGQSLSGDRARYGVAE